MRNHNEKSRDMARSVLPSTARGTARQTRASIHRRERARLRTALHALRAVGDPDDFDGDLTWIARRDIGEMVDDRRSADKVGPLVTWAERRVERDPALAAASPEDREVQRAHSDGKEPHAAAHRSRSELRFGCRRVEAVGALPGGPVADRRRGEGPARHPSSPRPPLPMAPAVQLTLIPIKSVRVVRFGAGGVAVRYGEWVGTGRCRRGWRRGGCRAGRPDGTRRRVRGASWLRRQGLRGGRGRW